MQTNQTNQATEQGAASMIIELRDGDITVRHGQDGTLLALRRSVPPGVWHTLWSLLETLGIRRVEDIERDERARAESQRVQEEANAKAEAERLAKVPQIALADVVQVYVGKAHRCACGCSGTHSYASRVAKEAGGYDVRVSDRAVANAVRKINGCQPEEREDQKTSTDYACAVIGDKMYVAYFSI